MKEAMDRIMSPLLIIAFAVVLRLLPHIPNVAPIATMALFGGVYLNKKYALIVPLLAMLVSDFFLGFHATMPFVYGSFLFTGLLGLWLRSRKSIPTIIGITLLSSLLFFLITNFGVWFIGDMYPKTISGLVTCYLYALPFLRNTIIGDIAYTGLFFGGYEAIRLVVKGLRLKPAR